MAESERIFVRGDTWTVLSRTAFRDCGALLLAGSGAGNAGISRTVLLPFDRPRRLDRCSALRVVRPRRFLHAARRAAARSTPYGGFAHAARSSIELLPFQMEPALAVLRHGRTRVLVADEVGLGKTVQAGLILNELAAASDSFRGLVICPAGLRDQWAGELRAHFALESLAADAAWLTRAGRELPPDVNPWVLPGLYVSSFDFVKRPEVLRPLEDVLWDALVVDEAHLASSGSNRRSAVHAVALRSRRVVLLSATPHAGDSDQFDALCRVGAGTEPITIFRRSRHETGQPRARKTVFFLVRTSAAERRMHRLLASYTARVAREATARGDSDARMAAIVLRKRALSSAGSLASSARRRQVLLAGAVPDSLPDQLRLPLDEDPLDDQVPDAVLGAPGLADPAAERRTLADIANAADAAARHESKAMFLVRLLARAREPMIVFTEYRDTLERLETLLRHAGHDPARLHGGMTAGERSRVQRAFNEQAGILLATDAASEGLNLHQRCRIVLHYELPWSPVRLEQRTGRVDRYGQRKKVHELFLVASHTAERLVLAPLARRAVAAAASMAGSGRLAGALTESAVARAVLDDEGFAGLTTENSDGGAQAAGSGAVEYAEGSLRAEADCEAARLGELRSWRRAGLRGAPVRRRPERPVVTRVKARTGALAPGVVCIYTVALRGGDEQVIDSAQICIRVSSQIAPRRIRKAAEALAAGRSFLDACTREIDRHIKPLIDERIEHVRSSREPALAAARQRERLIASQAPSEARRLVQASLFDQRAVRAHEARQQAGNALVEQIDARLDTLERSRQLRPDITLVALLLIT